MTKLVIIAPFSPGRFLDRHKTEVAVSVQIPLGLYLTWVAVADVLPMAFFTFQAGTTIEIAWGSFYLLLAALFFTLGMKLMVTASLQLMILKSLKTMQFARTKRLCLRGIAVLKHWPLVRGTEISFFEVGLGAVCMGRADYDDAESLYASAISRYRNFMARSPWRKHRRIKSNMIILLCHFARACAAQDKFAEAEAAANEALELARQPGRGALGRLQLLPLSVLGYAHLRAGILDKAEEEYQQVLKVYDETPPPPSYGTSVFAPVLMAASLGLAIISIKKDNPEQSLKYWSDVVLKASNLEDPMSPSFLRAFNILGNEYMNRKLFVEAETVLDMAYALALHHFDHPDAKVTLSYFEKLLLLTDRQAEVNDMRGWLRLSQQVSD